MSIEQERKDFERDLEKIINKNTSLRHDNHQIWLTRGELFKLYQARAAKVPTRKPSDVYDTARSSFNFAMIPPRDGYKEKFYEGWNACIDAMLNKEG